jgi:hypothetical protein
MMTIDKNTEAKILRYHFVEKWRVGTIATQLGIHHSVVDRVLAQAGLPKVERSRRASLIDNGIRFKTIKPKIIFTHISYCNKYGLLNHKFILLKLDYKLLA